MTNERTRYKLAAASACGRKGGPKFKMTSNKIRQDRSIYGSGSHTVQEITDTFFVSPGPAFTAEQCDRSSLPSQI